MAEFPMSGGWQTEVHRDGDIVRRSAKPQSATVIALLQHLADASFDAAPHPVGSGFGPDGREQLSFIDGVSPQPAPWSDDAAHRIGQMLRALHDATATFEPPTDAVWQPWFARSMRRAGGDDRRVIGHGDLGPWNILAIDALPVGFIDWDNAGPVDAVVEVAQVAWLNAQLHDDDVGDLNDLASPDERARQLGLIVEGYGLDRPQRRLIVDTMVEFALRAAREEAVEAEVGPQTASPSDHGYPLLWAVTWRARAAAWMLDHRSTLARALD